MIPFRFLPEHQWPARLVYLFVLSLLLISAAPYPPEPVLLPPPAMPDGPLEAGPAGPVMAAVPPPSTTALTCTHCTYLPIVSNPLDPFDRASVANLYAKAYLPAAPAIGWTGSFPSSPTGPCNAGTTSAAFQAAVLRRINYYREMAGVPQVRNLTAALLQQYQEAAYMMAVNNNISYEPPSTWTCYTAGGGNAAKSAMFSQIAYGPNAIHIYMDDSGQPAMGHRRWLLYPQTQAMASGDVPGSGSAPNAIMNAVNSWDAHLKDPRPATRYAYVAWPPPGYVPYTVINDYWSFSFAGADFSQSSVSVSLNGKPLGVTRFNQSNNYGENTLVWKINNAGNDWPKPTKDTLYTVTITNVGGNSYSYPVIVFDPGS